MKKELLTILYFCVVVLSYAQQKTITASRIQSTIKIDGELNESEWNSANEATDFTMLTPDNGTPAPVTHKSSVKLLYDDTSIYIAAYLHDPNPESITNQFTLRDNVFGETDVFTIAINPYNDGINENKFYVTSAGTQGDSKTIPNRRRGNADDFSINYVWESSVNIVDDGWIVEIKIPYSALRFSSDTKDWSINFFRDIKSLNQIYSWNYVDRSIGREAQYHGLLKGISNITPPLRLNFLPFVSGKTELQEGEFENDLNFGLDVKYGLSDSFTLDATLIPDFSQTGFDALTLNLGPFEQTFREQRQFFTEGVELFEKGDLFFSRRIGNAPSSSPNLKENEEIIDSPTEVKVLNALKLSGRTKKGLGIGFFNAITESTSATIRDTNTGEERKEEVEPFTNYNVFVLDQQFNNNSSVAFTNTNVFRTGSFRDANVSALSWDISTRSNSYNINGNARLSAVNDTETLNGFSSELRFSKTKGNFRFGVNHRFSDDKFDNNDLGRQFRNNFSNFGWNLNYQTFTPTQWFNSYRIFFWGNRNYLYKPNVHTGTFGGIDTNFTLKNFDSLGFEAWGAWGNRYDYFEPRVAGRFFKQGIDYNLLFFYNTDRGKKLSSSFRFHFKDYLETEQRSYNFRISPRYRFNNKLNISYSLNLDLTRAQTGYVDDNGTDVIFGDRDRIRTENQIQLNYNFNTKQALSLNFRHFWTTVQYKNRFYDLLDDGTLQSSSPDLSFNPDTNFNVWNLDLSYSWQFAPGSQAILLYRNSIFQNTDEGSLGYFESLNNLFEEPIKQTLSLRIVYYLDYLNVKNIFKSKSNI
ncbi:DUF5916 domain-containing protein [Aquimarina rhabdastrellae]